MRLRSPRPPFALFLSAALIAPVYADGPPDDETVAAHVRLALINAYLKEAREVEISALNGEVDLSGSVDSAETRADMARVAGTVKGVTAVRNGLQVKNSSATLGHAGNDSAITANVRVALRSDSATGTQNIRVETTNGVVELDGSVDSLKTKDRAEMLTQSVDGVDEVVNHLSVRD